MNTQKENMPEEPFDPDEDHPAEAPVLPEVDPDEPDLLNKIKPG